MRNLSISFFLSICIISIAGRAFSQVQSNTWPWPEFTQVGIGTGATPVMLAPLQINYDTSSMLGTPVTWEALIRLSNANGAGLSSNTFGILGLMSPHLDANYSSLSRAQDLILHENQGGDIIITNYWPGTALTHETGGSIRFATAGDTIPGSLPADSTRWRPDYERLTIGINGNVGIDLPPTSVRLPDTGLDTVLDQVQIGGGSVAPLGEIDPLPGLTISGGSPWEGLSIRGDTSQKFPLDWRYISFNEWVDHTNPSSNRGKRIGRMSSSSIGFSDVNGGMVSLAGFPYDSVRGKNDFSSAMWFQIYGTQGLRLFSQDSGGYHGLFEVWPRGLIQWPVTRNVNGLGFFHVPLYIGTDTAANFTPDFTNFSGLRPDIGDDSTWMLAVNGPALMKELFILDSTWADYVFDPSYKLPPLGEVENYINANHHLPDIEPAKQIAKTGIPVGRTEEALTKKVEELTLYVIDQNKKIEMLEADIQELKNRK